MASSSFLVTRSVRTTSGSRSRALLLLLALGAVACQGEELPPEDPPIVDPIEEIVPAFYTAQDLNLPIDEVRREVPKKTREERG